MGLSHAKYLSKKGFNLALVDISKEACNIYNESKNLNEIISNLSINGLQVKFFECDLTDLKHTVSVFDKIIKDFNCIDGAVFNAGGDII